MMAHLELPVYTTLFIVLSGILHDKHMSSAYRGESRGKRMLDMSSVSMQPKDKKLKPTLGDGRQKPPPQPAYDPVLFVDQIPMDSSVVPVIINEHPSIVSSSVDVSAQNCEDVFENDEELDISLSNLMDNFEKNCQAKGVRKIMNERYQLVDDIVLPPTKSGSKFFKTRNYWHNT